MVNIRLSRSPAALNRPVKTFIEVILPFLSTSISNEAASNLYIFTIFHTLITLRCPLFTNVRNT
jgi:hypothetical protein